MNTPAASGSPLGHHEVSAHLDAAFYHESAAFHHRQAALHGEAGRLGEAERHLWAAFGHSLNAHESTRARLSGSRGGASPDFGHDHDSTKGSVDPEPRA